MSSEFLEDKWLKKLDLQTQSIINRVGTDRKTQEKVFDTPTLLTLGKLISDEVFDIIDFPISAGKEAFVFRGVTKKKTFVAIKIYRTATLSFKKISQYIVGDPRFASFSKHRRDLVFEWAKKEYKNLQKLQHTKVHAPKPIKLMRNVVVMQYIGDTHQPAPLLKDVVLQHPHQLADTLIFYLTEMYQKAHLVHADFSPYNILYYHKTPYVIDIGQGVLLDHPESTTFLQRDISTIVHYFKKYHVSLDKDHIYKTIINETGESDSS